MFKKKNVIRITNVKKISKIKFNHNNQEIQ